MMLTMAFAAMMGGSLMAQNTAPKQQDPAQRSAHLTDMMVKHLKLTPEQVPKVKDINDRFAKEMVEIRDQNQQAKAAGKAVKGDAQAKAKDINMKKDEELKAVLTPAQMTEWQKMEAEMMARTQQRREANHQAKQQAPATK